MLWCRITYVSVYFLMLIGLPVTAEEIGARATKSAAQCACPKEGIWKVQNLEGWMDCTGPVNLKQTLKEVKDDGTVWILEEDCSRVFGEASRKKDEDVVMTRNESCGYAGRINGEENGVNMSINVTWTIEGEEFISGEMHAKPSLQGMTCEYFRPFEIKFDESIPSDDYEKRRQKMLKKLEKIEKSN